MSWKHERWAKILARSTPDMAPSTKLVLQHIAFRCFDEGDHVHLSTSSIVADTGLSMRTVNSAVKLLASANLVNRTVSKGKAPLYHFPLPPHFDAYATDLELSADLETHDPRRMTQADIAISSVEAALRAAGYDSLEAYQDTVFDSPEDKAYHESLFAHCFDAAGNRIPGTNPGDVLRGLMKHVGQPLPYDPTIREDGIDNSEDRYKYDKEY